MRAQLKMFETIAVLVVFLFLLAVVAVFYLNVQRSTIEDEKLAYGKNLALQVALRALYFPELDCHNFRTQQDNCIDVLKLEALSQIMQNESVRYFEEFGYSEIKVQKIYPENDVTWELYKLIPDDFTTRHSIQSPVLLYDGRYDTYAFGVIEVRSYE